MSSVLVKNYSEKRGKMNIGEKIEIIRKEKNLYQKELAEIVKTSQKTISNIENGTNEPKIGVIVELCNQLDISADWLLLNKENPIISNDEKELLNIYKAMNETNKGRLIGRAEAILEEQEENDSTTKTAIS